MIPMLVNYLITHPVTAIRAKAIATSPSRTIPFTEGPRRKETYIAASWPLIPYPGDPRGALRRRPMLGRPAVAWREHGSLLTIWLSLDRLYESRVKCP